MKVLNCFLCMWLAILVQVFVSCSKDDPINDRQETEQEVADDEGDDEKDDEDEVIEESIYQPYVTDKRVSELVVEQILDINGMREVYYSHYQFSYDEEGRISKELYFSQPYGEEPADTIVTTLTYSGNMIYLLYDRIAEGFTSDYDIELNSQGYVSGCDYDEDGYLVGYHVSGYNNGDCRVRWENGNLVSETKPVGSYYCTYTDYLNDTSLDLTSFLIRSEIVRDGVSIPCDTYGKRSVNLPESCKMTHSTSDIRRNFAYEFDSQGRVSKIMITEYYHTKEKVVYHLKYEE